jgi:hypothetical protein
MCRYSDHTLAEMSASEKWLFWLVVALLGAWIGYGFYVHGKHSSNPAALVLGMCRETPHPGGHFSGGG